MERLVIPIQEIVDLATQTAVAGAIRIAEIAGDGVYEQMISVIAVIYEMDPG